MRDYVIVTESTTDLPQSLIDELGIHIIPMEFTIDEKTYYNYPDNSSLSSKNFYDLLREGKSSTTSLINTSRFMEVFLSILEKDKDILYIGFSSALSGSFNASTLAVNVLSSEYPERKILAVDSLAASMGEGLLVYLAAKKKAEGMDITDLYNWVVANKLNVCQWFTVEDLHHLKRGGRVSATSAIIGSVLNIKPILHVDENGKLILVDKIRGRKYSMSSLVEIMKKKILNPEKQTIFVSHGDCIEDAKQIAEMIKNELNVNDVLINTIGPVIGSHSGPGTIAVFFMGSKR